jgi:hemerythrin HHE cation binding domain-containing protein
MKRSPALASLSRDHHQALAVALRLRRATADDAEAVAEAFAEFWEDDGRLHFDLEERLLLPAVPGYGDPAWAELSDRVRAEHRAIRRAAAALPAAAGAQRIRAAHELGVMLQDHVRFEERRLFALLQDRLPEDRLVQLGRTLAAANH